MTDENATPADRRGMKQAELQSRILELEHQQDRIRSRLKDLRAKKVRLSQESDGMAIERAIQQAMDDLEPESPEGHPRGNVVETVVQRHGFDPSQVEDGIEAMKRWGEVYVPVAGYLRRP